MIKRNHPLTIGELVYDVYNEEWARIVRVDEGEEQVLLEAPDGKGMTWLTDINAVYQVVPNLTDKDGNPICYEHDTEMGWCGEEHNEGEAYYPYFAPYLQENLFEFETYPVGN